MTSLRLPYSVSVTNQSELRLSIYNPKTEDTLYASSSKMATIVAYQDDVGYDLQFTVTDVDGNPFNLTGATVYFRAAKPCDSSLVINGSCTLDPDPTTGQCSYTTSSGDFSDPGVMDAELYISVAGKEIRIGGMEVEVRKRLPTS